MHNQLEVTDVSYHLWFEHFLFDFVTSYSYASSTGLSLTELLPLPLHHGVELRATLSVEWSTLDSQNNTSAAMIPNFVPCQISDRIKTLTAE